MSNAGVVLAEKAGWSVAGLRCATQNVAGKENTKNTINSL
jgi:hypothetical protein